jgi:hypothetical protein
MGAGIFTGLPKQLAGVSKLMQMMDWESEEGETNEGMVGTFVNFGNIGAEFVVNEQRSSVADSDSDNDDGKSSTGTIAQHQDDVFILLCPQNMVGTDSSIIPWLQEMVEAAGDRPVILINPDLADRVSAAGQQSVRGRQQRMDFASSFETIYHWQDIYVSGTSYFPILGTITKLRPDEQWIAYQRRDFRSSGNGEIGASDEAAGEIYVPVLTGETKPTGQDERTHSFLFQVKMDESRWAHSFQFQVKMDEPRWAHLIQIQRWRSHGGRTRCVYKLESVLLVGSRLGVPVPRCDYPCLFREPNSLGST